MIKVKIKKSTLKEELETEKKSDTFIVETSPDTFLELAKEDKSIVQRSYTNIKGAFDPKKAGEIFLVINSETGEVLHHEGRARTYAAKESDIEKYKITIKTHKSVSWNEIPNDIVSEDKTKILEKNKIFKLISAVPKQEEERNYRLMGKNKVGDYVLLGMRYNLQSLKNVVSLLSDKKIVKLKDGHNHSQSVEDYDILSDEEKQELISSL